MMYDLKTVLGNEGHFITSPEISQMFGECIAVWLVNEWMKMGEPGAWQLVEFGPGKGTLASDILRTIARVRPEALQGLSLHFVEVSTKLRQMQRTTVCGESNNEGEEEAVLASLLGPTVTWHRDLRTVPYSFSFFIAHEFFDALAVNCFERAENGEWREVLVDVVTGGVRGEGGEALRLVRARHATPACVVLQQPGLRELLADRSRVELSTAGLTLARQLGERVAGRGGAALIADYGRAGETGDTLRAFRHHQQVDPLLLPGTADLTADVDFSQLALQCGEEQGSRWLGPVSQQQFLLSCGIGTRVQQLLATAEPDQQQHILHSYHTLTSNDKMGERFKFAAIFPASMQTIHEKYPPVGFENCF